MGQGRDAAQIIFILIALSTFLGYHAWFFRRSGVRKDARNWFSTGRRARLVWSIAVAYSETDALLGVQTCRNAIMACSFLAGVSSLLASEMLSVLFDADKVDRIEIINRKDPLLKGDTGSGPVVDVVVVLSLGLGVLLLSVLSFVYAVRLYVHTSFFSKAVSSHLNKGLVDKGAIAATVMNAQLAFTIGMRLLFLFIPLVMWIVGPTALLITSLLTTALIAMLDSLGTSVSLGDATLGMQHGDKDQLNPLAARDEP